MAAAYNIRGRPRPSEYLEVPPIPVSSEGLRVIPGQITDHTRRHAIVSQPHLIWDASCVSARIPVVPNGGTPLRRWSMVHEHCGGSSEIDGAGIGPQPRPD